MKKHLQNLIDYKKPEYDAEINKTALEIALLSGMDFDSAKNLVIKLLNLYLENSIEDLDDFVKNIIRKGLQKNEK